MSTTACAACGTATTQRDLFSSARGPICGACQLDEDAQGAQRSPWKRLATVGAVAGAVPFGLKIQSSSMVSGPGGVQRTFYDYVALTGGGVAALLALAVAALVLRSKPLEPKGLAAAAGIAALATYQLLRGVGIISGYGF